MNYTRAKKIDRAAVMTTLIKQAQISPEGADWLTLRLDPYHDFNRPIAGYPDTNSYNTIVSVNNYEYNITQPTALGANWDCHIFTLPFTSLTTYLGNMVNGQFTATAATYTQGLVTVAKDAAEGPLYPTAVPVASANFSMTQIDAFANVEDGQSRVIGLGIEVIDTTSALYKQGSLLAYKMPATSSNVDYGYLNAAGTGQYQVHALQLQTPPSTAAEAILYRDSVQWEAKDGVYMAVGQEGIENQFRLTDRNQYVITPDITEAGTDPVLVTAPEPLTALQVPPLLTAGRAASLSKIVNVTQSGIIIKGLSQYATLKLRVRVYIERAPMRGETSLIPLAGPSAPYDYKALAMYSVLQHELPIAVPVGFNAKGDWWKMVLDAIHRIAPIVGGVLAPVLPVAPAIGNAVGMLAGGIRNLSTQNDNKKKVVIPAKTPRKPNKK
jgi:hypothetical protein